VTGAIEFLQKAKAICDSKPVSNGCKGCPLQSFCNNDIALMTDESDLVRKVMEYRINQSPTDDYQHSNGEPHAHRQSYNETP
jgi:hypothetical protein